MSDCKTKFTLDNSPDMDVFFPPAPLCAGAHVKNLPGYHQLYDRSTRDTDNFWLEIAKELYFNEFSERGLEWNFDLRKGPIFTRFLAGSTTNLSYNCLERQVEAGGHTLLLIISSFQVAETKSLTSGSETSLEMRRRSPTRNSSNKLSPSPPFFVQKACAKEMSLLSTYR
jgi:acetyl-CoA synthetase